MLLVVTGCSRNAGLDAASSGPTEAEYMQAVKATVDCIEREGFTVLQEPNANGLTTDISVQSSIKQQPVAGAALERCNGRYLAQVEADYLAANAATGAERERRWADLIECLRVSGVTGIVAGMKEEAVSDAIYVQLSDIDARTKALSCMSAQITLFT